MTERPAQLFFTTSDYPHASKHTNVIASSRIRLWRPRKSSEDNVGHIKLRFWWRRTYSYHMKMAVNKKPIKRYPNMETFKLNEGHRWARRIPTDTLEKFCNERLMLTRLINKRTHIYTHTSYTHIKTRTSFSIIMVGFYAMYRIHIEGPTTTNGPQTTKYAANDPFNTKYSVSRRCFMAVLWYFRLKEEYTINYVMIASIFSHFTSHLTSYMR
jgi:hypothetical protein